MKGTHGTCITHADDIQKSGFTKSNIGHAGSGVYFWSYYDEEDLLGYATDLAIAWWKFRSKYNNYDKCDNKSCSIIHVQLEIKNGRFIDLEKHDVRGNKILWINQVYSRLIKRDKRSRKALSNAYDLYIKMLENKFQEEIDIIHIAVKPPEGFESLIPAEIRGWPSCYVVRNLSCINILSNEVL